jgi:hypothetical protein
MNHLKVAGVASLCISILLMFAVAITRKKYVAYISQLFFVMSFVFAAIFAWQKQTYWCAALFVILAISWLYKLSKGGIISDSLL